MNAAPNTEDSVVAQWVYKWVLCVRRELKLEELEKAVSIELDGKLDEHFTVRKGYIMKVCANFIVYDRLENVLFAHSLVIEYLKSRGLDQSAEYSNGRAHE